MPTYTSSDDDDGWGLVLAARAWVDATEIASSDPGVVSFRDKLPNGKPLPRSKVNAWANRIAIDEGGTTLVSDRFTGESLDHDFKPGVIPEKEPLVIELLGRPHRVLAEGTLGELLALSHRLADQFGWSPKRAALWVVTSQVRESLIESTRSWIECGPHRAKEKTWNRVTIESPAEIPASYVADVHLNARLAVAKRQPTLTLRGAPIGAKQLNVMTFCVERNDGRSWESMLSEWEETRTKGKPGWRYKSFRNFARDARDTYQRVMGRPWEHGRFAENDDGEA